MQVLPFFQFYRGAEGRVAAFSASVAKVQRLRDALSQHSSPYCSLGASPVISELSSLLSVDEVRTGRLPRMQARQPAWYELREGHLHNRGVLHDPHSELWKGVAAH